MNRNPPKGQRSSIMAHQKRRLREWERDKEARMVASNVDLVRNAIRAALEQIHLPPAPEEPTVATSAEASGDGAQMPNTNEK